MIDLKIHKRQIGVTLPELLVVIAIILILAVVVVPSIASVLPHYKLKGGSQELVSAIRESQNLATTTQQTHLIRFNINENSYSSIRKIDDAETIIKTTNLPGSISLFAVNITNNQVSFNSSGAPTNAGTIILTNTKGATITIEITNSGQIKSY